MRAPASLLQVWLLSVLVIVGSEQRCPGGTQENQHTPDDTSLLQLSKTAAHDFVRRHVTYTSSREMQPEGSSGMPHAPARKDRIRSNREARWICFFVFSACIAGWLGYNLALKFAIGAPNPTLKLPLLSSAFCLCSWGTLNVNANLTQQLGSPVVVAGVQLLLTACFTLIAICISRSKLTGIRDQVMTWSFISLPLGVVLVFSFIALEELSPAVFVVIWSVRPLLTLLLEPLVIPKESQSFVTKQLLGATLLLLCSAGIYFGPGFAKVALNQNLVIAASHTLLVVLFVLAQRRLLTTECKDLSIETCMLLENLFGLIPVAIIAFSLAEVSKVTFHELLASESTLLLFLTGLINTARSYLALALQREMAATSFMVVENIVNMAMIVTGAIIFVEPLSWPWQGGGLILRFAGALWFAKSQLEGAQQLKALDTARRVETTQEKRLDMLLEDQAPGPESSKVLTPRLEESPRVQDKPPLQ